MLPKVLPVVMCGCFILFQSTARPQVDSASPPGEQKAFQVATIKESATDEAGGIAIRGRQFLSQGTTVVDLMAYAYGLQQRQVIDGPPWARKQRYDIVATMEGKPESTQTRSMLAALLVERFHLSFEFGERSMPVLSIHKLNGPLKLQNTTADPSTGPGIGFNGPGSMTIRNATVAEFAQMFQRYVADRPIIDNTGIRGKFDFTLVWNPDPTGEHNAVPAPAEDRMDLYASFKEQLGLELSRKEALAPVLLIKELTKPSAN